MASLKRLGAAAVGLGRTWWTGLGDLLLPQVCHGCQARRMEAAGLCPSCSAALLDAVARAYCMRCGASLGPGIRDDPEGGCWLCPSPQPRFRRVARVGPYRQPLRKVIQRFKYRRIESMRNRLEQMLAQAVRSRLGVEFDLLLPVPMHWTRRLLRGFDHARLLAEGLGRRLDLPVGDELVRTRPTPPQVHLPRSRRIENVRGAFALRPAGDVRGLRILLIDDVTTSGATANEAAKVLRRAGAGEVDLAVLAKADPPRAFADPPRGRD